MTKWLGLLEETGRAILALHLRPDGDAVASNLALARVLESHGHQVTIVSPHHPPAIFSFLPGFERIVVMPAASIPWEHHDVFWALDLASPDMLTEAMDLPPNLIVRVIDHHQTNPGWGTLNLIDPAAPSTTAVLASLFARWNVPLDEGLATLLLTGLATDTGFFAYAATADAFHLAGDFIAHGAGYQEIAYHVNQQTDPAVLREAGAAMQRLELFPEERLAVVTVPFARERPRSGAIVGLLTRQISTVAGIDAGAVLIETAPGDIRIELRARPPGFDVAGIATRLGGGGHRAAAGARFRGTLADAVSAIRQAMA